MAEPVIMPRQGQSVESCIFTEWYKKTGDPVKKGDLLFAYETDKAAFEQEAQADGILLAVFVGEGDEVPVLENIGVIGNEGEAIESFRPAGKTGEDRVEVPQSSAEQDTLATPADAPAPEVPEAPEGLQGISPRARNRARLEGVDPLGLSGTGPYGRVIERDILAVAEGRSKVTPLAKSIALKDQLPLPKSGSGVGGRVLAADVIQKPSVTLADDYEDVKLSNVRKIIARNMFESLANTAQLTLHASADARRMLDFRQRAKARMAEGYSYNITINDMVSFATIQALLAHPEVNAHFLGDAMRKFSNVHVGFAVDTPRGLMVPTLKNANHLTLEGLSAQMKSLATACQEGAIDPELLQGATFTISNLGAFGIEMFTPVLNPPQVGILGVNTIALQPAKVEGGILGFIPRIGLSLTFDHRALDGAPAAAFLKEVSQQIENIELPF
jgi:pyruvate dehydrogenase E2 component (dihydrolipoamide acetyltransferase)